MATVGQRLATPEAGWRRYDDNSSYFTKSPNVVAVTNNSSFYSSTYISAQIAYPYDGSENYIRFKFMGSKVRLISSFSAFRSNNIKVTIDGIVHRYNSGTSGATVYQVLVFEKTGLAWGEHEVEISLDAQTEKISSNNNLLASELDAVDIDSDGYLIARVGTALTSPEPTWKRYDSNQTLFSYSGAWDTTSNASYYGGSINRTVVAGSKVQFMFFGSKIRIITGANNTVDFSGSSNLQIDIDGTSETFSINAPIIYQRLSYEKFGLENKLHTVSITLSDNKYFWFDAIDIDDTGELRNPYNKFLILNNGKYQAVHDNLTDFGVAQFKFDESTGNTLHNNVGIINGIATGTSIVTGYSGNARSFNGTSDYISIPKEAIPIGTKSIRFKIKTAQTGTSKRILTTSDGSLSGFMIYMSNGLLGVLIRNSSAVLLNQIGTHSPINDNQWHDVVLSWDASISSNNIKLYIDDMSTPAQTFSVLGTEVSHNFPINIGRDPTNTSLHFSGQLDELEIYNRVIDTRHDAWLVEMGLNETAFINHGVDYGKSIDLNKPRSKKVLIKADSTTLDSGKVFKQTIDTAKTPIKAVSIE